MAKTKKTQQSPELTRRVATYSALASAAILAGPAADAALHVWDVNQTLGPAAFFESASFSGAFSIGFASSGTNGSPSDRYFWGPNNNLSFINSSSPATATCNEPARLGNGIVVGSAVPGSQSGNWRRAVSSQTSSNDIQASWSPGDQGYMGIRFVNGLDHNYGWVDMTMNPDGTVTVNRWALEDTVGASVTTPGAVPEPGSGAMLALLAMGAVGLRRRRQTAAV
jgi:hypothetical protein